MRKKTVSVWILILTVLTLRAPASAQPPAPRAADALPAVIPIFPLEDATLFPKAANPFHIFEPRYRAMVADALKSDRIIGMVTLKPGFEANYEGRPAVYDIGCAGVIEDFEELADGRFNVLLRGLTKFRIVSEDQSKPYRLARVEAIAETLDDKEKDALHAQRQRLEQLVTKPGSPSAIPSDISDEEVVNTLALNIPVDASERQTLLEMTRVVLRAQALIDLLAPPARR